MFSYLLLLLNKGGSEKTNTSSRACSQEQPHWLTNTFPLKICEFSFLPHTHASAGNRWLPELASSKILKLFVKNVVDKQSGFWINVFYLTFLKTITKLELFQSHVKKKNSKIFTSQPTRILLWSYSNTDI